MCTTKAQSNVEEKKGSKQPWGESSCKKAKTFQGEIQKYIYKDFVSGQQ